MNDRRARAGSGPPEAAVVLARCQNSPTDFGVRMQREGTGTWRATWAFEINAARAGREGYSSTVLTGSFEFAPGYPGCPGCSSPWFALCNACGKLGCWSGRQGYWKCPSCSAGGILSGSISRLGAGTD